jgi:hypothetical protein
MTDEEVHDLIRNAFQTAGIKLLSCEIRRFPSEIIVVIGVDEADFTSAVSLASEVDSQIAGGFITVKKVSGKIPEKSGDRVTSLVDPRVNDLIEVLNARSRTSEQQPSLRYIRDAAETLNVAISRRHHLIFGRRGVGKTALMLEAKKQIEARGSIGFWINVQTMRNLSASDAFLTTASRLCDLPGVIHSGRAKPPLSVTKAAELQVRIASLLAAGAVKRQDVSRLIPDVF